MLFAIHVRIADLVRDTLLRLVRPHHELQKIKLVRVIRMKRCVECILGHRNRVLKLLRSNGLFGLCMSPDKAQFGPIPKLESSMRWRSRVENRM
jgi:hypothetical protein